MNSIDLAKSAASDIEAYGSDLYGWLTDVESAAVEVRILLDDLDADREALIDSVEALLDELSC